MYDNPGNMNEEERELVPLEDVQVEKYLLDCIQIEPLQIEQEFIRAPRDLAYWNERYAQSVEGHLRAKAYYEQQEGVRRIAIKEERDSNGIKCTVDDLKALVAADEVLYAARMDLVDAEVTKVRIKGRLEAVSAKKDMLISVGAHIRAEMQGDPSIRRQHQDARAFDKNGQSR